MTKLETFGLPLVGCAMLMFGALWIREVRSNGQLSRDLQRAGDELQDRDAQLEGLQRANDRLQNRLREVPVLTVTGVEALVSAQAADPEEQPSSEWERMMEDPETLEDSWSEDTDSSPELTQEEQEERELRQLERAERRREFRLQIMDDLQARREFFSLINTEGLSPEYAESNRRLIEAMGEMQVQVQEMSNPDLTRQQRRELGRSMWQASREISELMDIQKDVLLFDYAELELGLDDQRMQEFLDYMKTVEAYTTLPRPGRRGGR